MSINASWVEVSPKRLRANVDTFRGLLGPETRLMTVVKSNAYGHGLELTARAIADRTDWFGVDALDEALSVQSAVGPRPTLILGYSAPELAPHIVRHGFRQVVYRRDTAMALSHAAAEASTTARIHLKVETGTNRQGIALDDLTALAEQIAAMPGIEIEGAYTHFANIEDTLDSSFARQQVERFQRALERLAAVGIRPTAVHASATAGILLYPDTHFNMVRLGVGAYGVWPSRETRIAARERGTQVTLEPALTWKTRIAQIKRIEEGEYVGYGLSFQAGRPTTLAVIPTGYYEGYDRHLSGNGRALVRGRAVPVAGRVAMNMTVLDVTDIPGAAPDDEVVLLGRSGDVEISADDLASRAGTISYEVLARINPLLERREVDS